MVIKHDLTQIVHAIRGGLCLNSPTSTAGARIVKKNGGAWLRVSNLFCLQARRVVPGSGPGSCTREN